MRDFMCIYCCCCEAKVSARLTYGAEIYPHRKDLYSLPFWKCDKCGNFVGCHYKTSTPTRPLGVIASNEIREARKHIHKLLDPIWKSGKMKRKEIYAKISKEIGWDFHTAKLKSIDEARKVYRIIQKYT